jgi:hypothetical protein
MQELLREDLHKAAYHLVMIYRRVLATDRERGPAYDVTRGELEGAASILVRFGLADSVAAVRQAVSKAYATGLRTTRPSSLTASRRGTEEWNDEVATEVGRLLGWEN